MHALAHSHLFELQDRAFNRLVDRAPKRRRHAALLRQLLANHEGLGQPQQVAWRQLAGDEAAGARQLDRRRQRLRKFFVELDLRRRCLQHLQRHADLDAAAREMLLHERAQPRLQVRKRRRQPQLEVEETVVHRTNRHADRAALIVAGQRGEACHALDHRERSAFCAAAWAAAWYAFSSRLSCFDSRSCNWWRRA